MVRSRRLELPPVLPDSDLNAARLPIPPRPHENLGARFGPDLPMGRLANALMRNKGAIGRPGDFL